MKRAPFCLVLLLALALSAGCSEQAPSEPPPGIAEVVKADAGAAVFRAGRADWETLAAGAPLQPGDRIRGPVTFRYANGEEVSVRTGAMVQVADWRAGIQPESTPPPRVEGSGD